ncbi:MFS transporter [Amycolatopsis taiwanensis]|uniref:MFS transporter n=1 Tax=Amycolatopsis taiwanensis TaxID=342230 RepID=UPI0025563167|nr:MFS transporter [Amycolatopsis taiwanensis]
MHTTGRVLPLPRARNAAFAALLIGMFMAALDTNVVVAALPSLAVDLGIEAAGGVTAAYLLAVAVTTPLHGNLGDRWGRRRMFAASVVVFAAGSLACAVAPTMTVLIGARAVQGVGGGGLIVAAVSAMAELFGRAEMLRRQGWLTAMFAMSSIGGAPLGGLLTAAAGWRAIFLLNLPCCVVALALGLGSVPGRKAARLPFDVAGAVLIAIAGSAIVVLGSNGALASSPLWTLLLVAVAAGAALAFVRVERRAPAPLVPPRLFVDAGLARAVVVTLLSGVALFGGFTYVSLAITGGSGGNPAATGLLLLPMSIGQVFSGSGFAALARRWPRIAAWGRAGLALGVAGSLGMAAIPLLSPSPVRIALTATALALNGAALGLSMQAYTVFAQSRAPKDILGAGMATLTFARQIGGSVGIAAFGWTTVLFDGSGGLSMVFLLAAVALLAGVVIAPRAKHDPPPSLPTGTVAGSGNTSA